MRGGYSLEPPEVSVKGKENSPNGWTTRKASKNVAKFCKSVRKAALWWTLMDIGCGLILQNCLAERKRCRWAAGEMKERKVDKKKFFLEAKKVQISLSCWYSGETCSRGPWLQKAWRFRQRQRRGRSPWSLCRCRSLLLLTQNQETSMQRAKISRFEKAQQSEENPNGKRAREVETLCEVKEDPREAIKRRKSLHEWMFACSRWGGGGWLWEWGGICMNVIWVGVLGVRPNCYCNYVAASSAKSILWNGKNSPLHTLIPFTSTAACQRWWWCKKN